MKLAFQLKQSNHNHNQNYNLMGFDTIEINLVLGVKLDIRNSNVSSINFVSCW